MSSSSRSQHIYDAYTEAIDSSELSHAKYMVLHINYRTPGSNGKKEETTRVMFIDIRNNGKREFLNDLKEKLGILDLSQFEVLGSEKDISIEDQEDFYGVVIEHANSGQPEEPLEIGVEQVA